jgi:hypothetical protein
MNPILYLSMQVNPDPDGGVVNPEDAELDMDKHFPPPNGPSAPFNSHIYDEENSIGNN